MDKDKRGKHAKASKINRYAKDSNYKRLNKAAKKHTSRKKKDKTLTIKSFCLKDGIAKGIHHSVMQRYFDNDCRRERSGQGRPYNCDTLLNKISMGITQERLETHSVINSVMKWFRFESEKRFNENKRRKGKRLCALAMFSTLTSLGTGFHRSWTYSISLSFTLLYATKNTSFMCGQTGLKYATPIPQCTKIT